MSRPTLDDERQNAWSAAKQAVRAYAREPSDKNAAKVSTAWRKVRRLTARDQLRALAKLAERGRQERQR
jgi:hypothetical protein